MSQRYTITEKDPLSEDTRVFRVLALSEAARPWEGRDVWASKEGVRWVCRCTECSSPTVAMLSSCAHARAVQRHLTPAQPKDDAQREAAPDGADFRPGGVTPAKHWFSDYLDGLVRRQDSTPASIVNTCLEWHAGEASSMHAFVQRKAVQPLRLVAEAHKALENMVLPAPDAAHANLNAIKDWAEKQHAMCLAAQALQQAEAAFHNAATGLDLEPHDYAQLRQLARRNG